MGKSSISNFQISAGKTPEERLWLNLLRQAVFDATSSADHLEMERMSARRWLKRRSYELDLASHALGVDPDIVVAWAWEQAARGWPKIPRTVSA